MREWIYQTLFTTVWREIKVLHKVFCKKPLWGVLATLNSDIYLCVIFTYDRHRDRPILSGGSYSLKRLVENPIYVQMGAKFSSNVLIIEN